MGYFPIFPRRNTMKLYVEFLPSKLNRLSVKPFHLIFESACEICNRECITTNSDKYLEWIVPKMVVIIRLNLLIVTFQNYTFTALSGVLIS
jgi:hypothetical protein